MLDNGWLVRTCYEEIRVPTKVIEALASLLVEKVRTIIEIYTQNDSATRLLSYG